MKWINNNWKILLVISASLFAFGVVGDLVVRIYLGLNFPLSFSLEGTTILNNIITPIAAVVSAMLFVGLSRRQQRLAESQNTKQNLEREFVRVEKRLKEPIGQQVASAAGITTTHHDFNFVGVNSLNYTKELSEVFERIRTNSDYISDHTSYLSNRALRVHHGHFNNRSYGQDLRFALGFTRFPTTRYNEVEYFLDKVITSEMLAVDMRHFWSSVESEWLQPYFQFLWTYRNFDLPDLFDVDSQGTVSWIKFGDGAFGLWEKSFRKLLIGEKSDFMR